jgi:hypothetical protein
MIATIVLQTPSSHIYYHKASLHSEATQFSISYTWNETVKQGMKWYFLTVSLHKHLFQLPGIGNQPMKQNVPQAHMGHQPPKIRITQV